MATVAAVGSPVEAAERGRMTSVDRGAGAAWPTLVQRDGACGLILALLLLAACAGARSGTAGPIHWEVENVREERRTEASEVHWYYTVVLTHKNGPPIRFERQRVTTTLWGATIGAREAAFEQTMKPGESLRLAVWQTISLKPGDVTSALPNDSGFQSHNLYSSPPPPVFTREFTGHDAEGRPVTVVVRFSP